MNLAEIFNAIWTVLSKVPLPAAIFSGVITIAPDGWLNLVGISGLRTDPVSKQVIGIMLIGSVSLLSAMVEASFNIDDFVYEYLQRNLQLLEPKK